TDSEAGVDMAKLRETFLASPWAQRSIWRAEYPVETHVAGVSVRGRIDAVFRTVERTEQGQRERWELVDWKTGRKPTAKQMRYKRIQLALYRLAFAKIQGVDPADVRAAFYYVGSDQTVWDSDIAGGLQSEAQLERIITRWDWEP
ncbi:MAG: PD-(D/E)XK nuclease family protein, partial [Rothia sp. (in: high G+C Gram-positive bacteria)]|uniref:PD-(D/E)XK nuclease family protein n=1 Tax=Rothia sp. (in: high G+C Gram-positive bacteria) TaxID=1885016 RepID=UPI0026DF4D49